MTQEIIYLCVLIGIGFIYVVNLHLRGSMSEIINGFLASVMLGLFAFSFFIFNWKYGIVCIITTLTFTNLIVPIASGVARPIMGYRTGIHESQESAFQRMASGKINPIEYLDQKEKETQRLRKKLGRLATRAEIAQILDDHELSLDDYVEHYRQLALCGLSDLSWDIVSNPEELSTLIEMKESGRSPIEISVTFRRLR